MYLILALLILIMSVITSGVIYIVVKNKGLREIVIALIIEAEAIFDYGKNSDKFNYVFDNAYNRLPMLLTIILTKENIIVFIQKVFDEIKIALDYNITKDN